MNHCALSREQNGNPTWTPAFRLECEARYLLGMPLRIRQDALKHPARAMRRADLEAEMKRQWQDGRLA